MSVQPEKKGGRRYFISGANSLLGLALFDELRNDHIAIQPEAEELENKFYVTVNPRDAATVPLPSASMKVLSLKTKPKTFRKQVASCDALVVDLMSAAQAGTLDEAEAVIKAVKERHAAGTLVPEQSLVLVTSVLTWTGAAKKLKKDFPVKKNDEGEVIPRDDESDGEELYFTDRDYQARAPAPKYQHVKTLEMLAMAAGRASRSLKVYVVCAGLVYGNGEDVFYEFFRSAWLSLHPELASLPIVAGGRNVLPTVHVADLTQCIKHLLLTLPAVPLHLKPQQYFVAVDQARHQTQERIMQAISAGMGSGLLKHVELADVLQEDWVEFLTLDLKFRTSQAFLGLPWHSPAGLNSESMPFLNKEFNAYRGLFPLKVFVTGPPAAGKTHFAQKLAESYGVPHVTIGELIAAAMKQTNAFGEELRNKIEELKDLQVAEYEKTRNKKKDPELDRSTLKPRLPEEYLYKILRMHMDTAACKNKGYILDGYPRTLADAKAVFLADAPDSQEEPFPGHVLNQEVLPQYVIVLQADDGLLKQRVKDLPAEKAANTHFTEAHMERRLKVYRETGDVTEFFAKALPAESVKTVNAFAEGDLLHELQAFIEVNGKPCCLNLITERDTRFLKKLEAEPVEAEEDELAALVRAEEEAAAVREQQRREQTARDAEEEEKRRAKEAADQAKLELVKQQERDLLDTRSQPIRQYLMDNLVPHLTQGLIDLCKRVPADPVDALADFLLSRADELDAKKLRDHEAAVKAKQDAKKAKKL